MYVNILKFKIDQKNGITEDVLRMFEDDFTRKPKGLDRFHIFKDKKKTNRFYLIEYWDSIDSKVLMEQSEDFPLFSKIHSASSRKHKKAIEADVVI